MPCTAAGLVSPAAEVARSEVARSATALTAASVIACEGVADSRGEVIVTAVSRPAAGDGRHRPDRLGQVTRDRVEDVLVTRAEDDMRSHAVRGLGHPRGDELGVALAAAFRLAVRQVPLAVMQRGRPSGVRIMLRAGTVPGLEQDAGNLIAGGVHDDVGPVPVGQQHHVHRPPRRGVGHLQQVRERPHPDRAHARPGRKPPGQQDLAVRRDHDPGTARGRSPRAALQRLGRVRMGAEAGRLARGVGPGHLPRVGPADRCVRHRDRGRHRQV